MKYLSLVLFFLFALSARAQVINPGNLPPSPAIRGTYNCGYSPLTNAPVYATCPQLGLGGRAISGSTSSDNFLFSDNGTTVTHDIAGSASNTETLPTATTLNNANYVVKYSNHSAKVDVITATTWTIQVGGAAGTTSINVPPGMSVLIKVDPFNASQWVADYGGAPSFSSLTSGSTITWTVGNAPLDNRALLFTSHSGSQTLNVTGLVDGGYYALIITQDGTGSEGLTLGSGCTWTVSGGGSGAITPSTAAGAVDLLTFTYHASNTSCLANFNKNFN